MIVSSHTNRKVYREESTRCIHRLHHHFGAHADYNHRDHRRDQDHLGIPALDCPIWTGCDPCIVARLAHQSRAGHTDSQ